MKFITSSACSKEDIDLLVSASFEVKDLAGDIVELGTYKGASAFALALNNPDKKVYACDLFGGNPYPGREDFEYLSNVDFLEIVQQASFFPNLALVRGMHEQTIPVLPVESISLLFMDSDHYESHVVGLTYLGPKVVQGGIIAFHDWAFVGVRQSVIDILNAEEWEFMEGKYEYVNPDQGMAFLRKNENCISAR